MRVYPFLLLILLAGAAGASSTEFHLEPATSGQYVVTGDELTIGVDQGTIRVVSQTRLADAWVVHIECTSSVACHGTISA